MSKLCSNAANCGLKKIQDALPVSLKTKISQSINISTYVFVLKNIEQAQKLLTFLEEKGFSNISIDSKGTTITAQSQSAANDDDTGSAGCKASKETDGCSGFNQSACSKHYIRFKAGPEASAQCKQCKWFANNSSCGDGGCSKCP